MFSPITRHSKNTLTRSQSPRLNYSTANYLLSNAFLFRNWELKAGELKTFEKAQFWNGTRSPLGGLLAGVHYLAAKRQQLLFKNMFDSYDLYDDPVSALRLCRCDDAPFNAASRDVDCNPTSAGPAKETKERSILSSTCLFVLSGRFVLPLYICHP